MPQDFVGSGEPLSANGFTAVQARLDVDPETLWSVLSVETRGFGYLADRRLKILYERHIFHKRTGGRFDSEAPDISSAQPGGYRGGVMEYDRIELAIELDRRAALESTSWGLGQIMGFNSVGLGYASVEDMVAQFLQSEDAQLEGVGRFAAQNGALLDALRAKRWERVAFFYNGSDFAKNGYDRKLQDFHDLYELKGTPNVGIRSAQARLAYLGFDPQGIDGVLGNHTRLAAMAFQKHRGLAVTGELDDATQQALKDAAGV